MGTSFQGFQKVITVTMRARKQRYVNRLFGESFGVGISGVKHGKIGLSVKRFR
jgi:hypothetical protein